MPIWWPRRRITPARGVPGQGEGVLPARPGGGRHGEAPTLDVAWYGGGRRRVEVVTGTGHWYKSGRPLVAVRWVFVRDLTGTHRDEYFFTTDSTWSPESDRDLHGSMEHRDHISRSTFLSPLGDDSRLEPEHGAASRPVPVRLVHGRRVPVRRIAVAMRGSAWWIGPASAT